jgi:chromosomal replication initiation ATPase DnaA
LNPPPALIRYLISRMDRSFAAAQQLVADLDERSLGRKKPLTRALAAGLLDNPRTVAR